jgi:hypothetical protein
MLKRDALELRHTADVVGILSLVAKLIVVLPAANKAAG